jgi:protein required for attachment to host cells
MDDHWIVVANRNTARVFAHRAGHGVVERETFLCPEARRPERDALTGAPGRTHDRMGAARHAMEPRTHVEEQVTHQFAQRVAADLEAGRTGRAYRDLVLVAGPDFLGELRSALSSQCRDRVVAECAKNIVHEDIPGILKVLPFDLRQSIHA